jgi:hypothetical protein
MAKFVVLWTSPRLTLIVSITDGVEEIRRVTSNSRVTAEKTNPQRQGAYYQDIIRGIRDAQEIFIFGSPQAKMELKSEILKTETLSQRVAGTEVADTMTETQLVARAREICGPWSV